MWTGEEPSFSEAAKAFEFGLKSTVRSFSHHGIKTVIIKSVPEQDFNVYDQFAAKYSNLPLRRAHGDLLGISKDRYFDRQRQTNEIIDRIVDAFPSARSVDPSVVFFADSEYCAIADEKASYFYDDDHLNDYGARKILGAAINEWLVALKTPEGLGIDLGQ